MQLQLQFQIQPQLQLQIQLQLLLQPQPQIQFQPQLPPQKLLKFSNFTQAFDKLQIPFILQLQLQSFKYRQLETQL